MNERTLNRGEMFNGHIRNTNFAVQIQVLVDNDTV